MCFVLNINLGFVSSWCCPPNNYYDRLAYVLEICGDIALTLGNRQDHCYSQDDQSYSWYLQPAGNGCLPRLMNLTIGVAFNKGRSHNAAIQTGFTSLVFHSTSSGAPSLCLSKEQSWLWLRSFRTLIGIPGENLI